MVLTKAKSNPLYHFINVICTDEEFIECTRWCTKSFGHAGDRSWNMELLTDNLDVANKLLLIQRKLVNPFDHNYRFRFAKIEHRDWFVLKWSS